MGLSLAYQEVSLNFLGQDMGSYKGIEVEDGLVNLLPHMQLVEAYRESLQNLQAVWDNLNLLGHLSATTTDMGSTRAAFSGLTSSLLNSLANRTLARRVQDISAKAQVTIDILVRNLFERTADIGFLATDDRIREYVLHRDVLALGEAESLSRRFKEYIEKYSVYFDVVLLSPQGEILERILPVDGIQRCTDPFVHEALTTAAPYVESYDHSSLFAHRSPTLIYSYRVNDTTGRPVAVLCLCFNLPDEMQRIFNGLERGDDWSVIALLDGKLSVIASSEPYLIPLGARLNAAHADGALMRFAGRNFLVSRRTTHGYQGYMGPGWSALVLVPIEYAFGSDEVQSLALDKLDASLYAAILNSDCTFSPALKSIPLQAEAIQRELERSVWNGNIRQSSANQANSNPSFSKILLSEISATGLRMKDVFSQSIGKLQKTVISSILDDCRFLARLAIDIMDRNLYERANDCRWWALDPLFCQQLARPEGDDRAEIVSRRLGEINDLYTVYENLLVFDVDQRVVGVSRGQYAGLVGTTLNTEWAHATLALKSSDRYVVSDFCPTPLYVGRPSYIYGAALLDGSGNAVGGIGIVFDSKVQFAAMLQDSLPPESPQAFGLFVDALGRVLASTDERYVVGTDFDLPADLLATASQPEGESRLIVLGNQVLAVGARQSSGYREYKGSADPYRNDVTAIVIVPMGEISESELAATNPESSGSMALASNFHVGVNQLVNGVEIATFHVGDHWLGLHVRDVVEAVELKGYVRIPNAPVQIFGSMIYQSVAIPLYNLRTALGVKGAESSAETQVVLIESDSGKRFGLLVDRLGDISEVALDSIEPAENIFVGMTPLLASIVKSVSGKGKMLTLLSVASVVSLLEKY
jgi:chemotaxis signal transduction protein